MLELLSVGLELGPLLSAGLELGLLLSVGLELELDLKLGVLLEWLFGAGYHELTSLCYKFERTGGG